MTITQTEPCPTAWCSAIHDGSSIDGGSHWGEEVEVDLSLEPRDDGGRAVGVFLYQLADEAAPHVELNGCGQLTIGEARQLAAALLSAADEAS
jgi:hypothetical protein